MSHYIINKSNICNILIHPFKGFTDYNEKGNPTHIVVIAVQIFLFIGAILERQLTGFIFNYNDPVRLNIFYIFAKTVVLFFLWVICNWAITTLFDGKGSIFKIAYISSIALIPYLVGTYLKILFSNLITPEEQSIVIIIYIFGILYSCFLLIAGQIVIHDYSLSKVLWSSMFTIFFILVILFIVVLIFSLFQQVYSFIRDILNEIYFMI